MDSLLTLRFDSPLQDTASSIFLSLPPSHCNAMQSKIVSLSSLNVDCLSPLRDSCQRGFSTCRVHFKHLVLVEPHLSLPLPFHFLTPPSLPPGRGRCSHHLSAAGCWQRVRGPQDLCGASYGLQRHFAGAPALPACSCLRRFCMEVMSFSITFTLTARSRSPPFSVPHVSPLCI